MIENELMGLMGLNVLVELQILVFFLTAGLEFHRCNCPCASNKTFMISFSNSTLFLFLFFNFKSFTNAL